MALIAGEGREAVATLEPTPRAIGRGLLLGEDRAPRVAIGLDDDRQVTGDAGDAAPRRLTGELCLDPRSDRRELAGGMTDPLSCESWYRARSSALRTASIAAGVSSAA